MKKGLFLFCLFAVIITNQTSKAQSNSTFWIDKFDQANFKVSTKGAWYTFTDSVDGGGSKIKLEYSKDHSHKSQILKYAYQLQKKNWKYAPYVALACSITTDQIPNNPIEAIAYEFKGSKHSFLYRTTSVTDYAFYQQDIPASKAWTTVIIPFSELAQPWWGKKAKFIPNDLNALSWQVVGANNDSGTVCIDNIRFIYSKHSNKQVSIDKQLKGFDERVNKIISDWNVAGCAIGIVKQGKLVYAKGFGYRDVEKKLPVTSNTLFPIGSNTKLFTATSVGLLVNEGKLDWDKPIKTLEPTINFFNEDLNKSISLRDMLSHRAGIPRYDMIWYRTNFNRKELFDRMKFLEPTKGYRESFMYNNLMYAAAGHIIQLKTGKVWEDYLSETILNPLRMTSTNFSVEAIEETQDYAKPYLSHPTRSIEFYRQMQGAGPAGSMNSNINDLSHWVICQLAYGRFENKQVIPSSVIQETLAPKNIQGPPEHKELSHMLYGMGRSITTYKGHSMNGHGGMIDGFVSQITFFPEDDLGIIILTNTGFQGTPNLLQYEIADRMLGLERTPWHERILTNVKKMHEDYQNSNPTKKDSIASGKPNHDLNEYIGKYENEIYGEIEIKSLNDSLSFNFHSYHLPLIYTKDDQFNTPQGQFGMQHSPIFKSNESGVIEKLELTLDGKQILFMKSLNTITIKDK